MGEKVIIIIPARYGSTRFPGKVLAPILGKPMIQYVYEGALSSTRAQEVIVATDDRRILEVVEGFGGKAILTRGNFASGTDRVYSVARNLDCDIVVNLQGDEPLVTGELLDSVIENLIHSDADIATPCYEGTSEEAKNPNRVKIVFDSSHYALYFSRSPIPFYRDGNGEEKYYIHIGIYAYRKEALERFVNLPPSRLENIEKLEQLRALENGFKIRIVEVKAPTFPVDTPEDLEFVENILKQKIKGDI